MPLDIQQLLLVPSSTKTIKGWHYNDVTGYPSPPPGILPLGKITKGGH